MPVRHLNGDKMCILKFRVDTEDEVIHVRVNHIDGI